MPQLMRERCTTKYYKILKELFIQVNYMEAKFLRDFRLSIQEYASSHPGCSYDELVDKFGAPEEVWYDYVGAQEPDYLLACVNKRHIKKYIFVCSVVVTFVCLVIYIIFSYKVYRHVDNSIVDEKETVITIIEEGD